MVARPIGMRLVLNSTHGGLIMEKVIMLLMLLTGSFAFADETSNKRGYELCSITTDIVQVKQDCDIWVVHNTNNNVFSVALYICGIFNKQQSDNDNPSMYKYSLSRSRADCFNRAISQIVKAELMSQDFKQQVDLCNASGEGRGVNFLAECLRGLFFKKAEEEANKRARAWRYFQMLWI